MARFFNVSIKEFSIGMGPRILKKRSKKNGIEYSLRAFPIGGFVSMEGEDEESEDENAFHKKKVWQRFLITFAGPFVNILFGVIIMFIYIATSPQLGSTVVSYFPEESVSVESGLELGDRILEVDGHTVHIYSEMSYEIMRRGIEPVDITVERDGKVIVIHDVVFPTVEESGTEFGSVDFAVAPLEKNVGNVLKESFYESVNTVKMIWQSLYDLIRGRYGLGAISGPVGVTKALVEVGTNSAGSKLSNFMNFIYLGAVISVNLGVMNLLPLPALDGGRIIFLLIEAIRRKPMKIEVEGYINFAGLVILLLFSAFIVLKDVIGLFT